MSKNKSSAKTLIIVDGDDEAEDAELNLLSTRQPEFNPFSFRQFVRNHEPDPGSTETNGSYRKGSTCGQLEEEEGDQGDRNADPAVRGSGGSQSRKPAPSTWEHALDSSSSWDWDLGSLKAKLDSGLAAAPEEEGDSSSSSDEESEEEDAGIRRTKGRGGGDYEGDDETTILETPDSFNRKTEMQQLQKENMCLRRSIKGLQKSSNAYKERIQQLSEELVHRRQEEEKEAQALESMVHSVEQNLQLMTKRAVKAENNVSKLKLELQHLQGHMEVIKSENERLVAEQLETITTMKRNALTAAEYLGKTATQARSSIKQLMGEADNLHLVSQLLQSIDKISTHASDTN